MAERAHVTSVEALDSFRASLLVYISKARPTVEEVSADLQRTRSWLQNDQRSHWETQIRRRAKELEQTQQELASARLSNFHGDMSVQQQAVRRAKQALETAETRLRTVKHWTREFDNLVAPPAQQLEKLHSFLVVELQQAAAFLAQAVQTLAAYAEVSLSSAQPATNSPTSSEAGDGAASVTVAEGLGADKENGGAVS